MIVHADLAELQNIACALGALLAPGDFIGLSGELGTGKTTFARFLIASLLPQDAPQDIPSPTFAMVQSYETPRFVLHHYDFYRLQDPREVDELGLDEAVGDGVVLAEWPERVADELPQERLTITFSEQTDRRSVPSASEGDFRNLQFVGTGDWESRLGRFAAMRAFLENAGWGGAHLAHLQGDASTRRYFALRENDRRVVLMDAPRQPDGPPIRNDKPYSAIAHLAEDVRPFVAVAHGLHHRGLTAPRVIAHDVDQGFLLLEDLGPRVFGAEIAQGRDVFELYRHAVDVLARLHEHPAPRELPLPDGKAHVLPNYDLPAYMVELDLLMEWYWPMAKGTTVPDTVRDEFQALWQAALRSHDLVDGKDWVLRDFHSPNLIWCPNRDGVRHVGLIDFQDALRGPAAYDVVSLLQDARSMYRRTWKNSC